MHVRFQTQLNVLRGRNSALIKASGGGRKWWSGLRHAKDIPIVAEQGWRGITPPWIGQRQCALVYDCVLNGHLQRMECLFKIGAQNRSVDAVVAGQNHEIVY